MAAVKSAVTSEQTASNEALSAELKRGSQSIFRLALRRFRRHRLGMVSIFVLAVILVLSLGAPFFAGHDPNYIDALVRNQPPSPEHFFGTDALGRDIWARVLYGGRVSLTVAVVAVSISLAIGVIFGLISGYYGGYMDLLMQRVLEVMSAVPALIIILSFVAVFGANIYNTMIILGLLSWESLARLVRGQTLQVRAQDFVLASQSVGTRNWPIMLNHVLPNVLPYVIVWITFAFTGVILTETALSYLGLGVQLPLASWGNLVGAAGNLRDIQHRPWTWLPAGLMITFTVLSLNFIGDALRDALDPHMTID
jgi:peptide/nickel transport system permease protein